MIERLGLYIVVGVIVVVLLALAPIIIPLMAIGCLVVKLIEVLD